MVRLRGSPAQAGAARKTAKHAASGIAARESFAANAATFDPQRSRNTKTKLSNKAIGKKVLDGTYKCMA
jgi:hypothetical protein